MNKFLLFVFLPLFLAHQGIDHYTSLREDPSSSVFSYLSKIDLSTNTPYTPFYRKDSAFQQANQKWRDSFVSKARKNAFLGRAIETDSPAGFFGNGDFITQLDKLPIEGGATQRPWSSTYWPIYLGILSIRYGNNEKNTIYDSASGTRYNWEQSINKYKEPQDFNENHNQTNFEEYIAKYFSPAEKYDLLVGDDKEFTLTNQNKNQGAQYWSNTGDVAAWMGICHGWAPAAFSENRPQQDVVVTAADGKTKIKFYADDIRGLSSLKWASSRYETLFVGGRCNTEDKNIRKDNATGFVLDYTCFDVNPATWHTVVANRIGLQKESFVIDATFDFQVWNQPVYKYNVTFFNVLDQNVQGDLNTCKVPIDNLNNNTDPVLSFIAHHKSQNAKNIVGVAMDLVYIAETSPSHNPPGEDKEVKVTYVYTLDLDENNNMLGGEWLVNQHPDFLWAPAKGAKPLNREDEQIASENIGPLSDPANLQKITLLARAASQRGEVLDNVVEFLVSQSSHNAARFVTE